MQPERRLSVLDISMADNIGGSARAAYRLHLGLRARGVRSRMLVGRQATADPDVRPVAMASLLHVADRLAVAATERMSLQYLFIPSSYLLPRHRWFREADVVQLFSTHGGYFSHTALPRLSRLKPVVWRLSDMWPLTGHCAYSYDCERWRTGCGRCPILGDYPALRHDTTAFLWRVKQWIYARSSLVIVAPSRWMAGLVGESPLLGRFPVHLIPNGIDTQVFRPQPKPIARAELGLPSTGRIVLFSAHAVGDRRKGGALLVEGLRRLAANGKGAISLLVIGEGASDWPTLPGVRLRTEPRVDDDRRLAAAYAAADVFVLPTLSENLPNGVLESLACGTPVVSFDVGGVPDAVRHMETGYLAPSADVSALARGIETLLTDDQLRTMLGHQARLVAEREFSLDLQARRFEQLYRDILASRRQAAGSTGA